MSIFLVSDFTAAGFDFVFFTGESLTSSKFQSSNPSSFHPIAAVYLCLLGNGAGKSARSVRDFETVISSSGAL